MVSTGLDVLSRDVSILKGARTGLLVNHTSVDSRLRYSWELLAGAGVDIRRIFSPEHGLFSTEQDQVAVDNQPRTGFDVVSLYGHGESTLAPSMEFISDLDAIVFDIQDVGSRYYTYLASMILTMKRLHGTGTRFVVLDRPNPLSGDVVEGPVLERGYESFVGLLPVSVRHGLTAGETAMMAMDMLNLDVDLRVVAMEGWRRDMYYDATGLPWVHPSPNMPSPATALVYPGMCLLEGTNLSEGRGTTTPFELSGAPWVDAFALADALNVMELPGVRFRAHYFIPVASKYAGAVCGGVFIHVTDRGVFSPFACSLALLAAVRDACPDFRFTTGVYEFRDDVPAFDLLTGSGRIRTMFLEGAPVRDMRNSWLEDEKEFCRMKRDYHIYRTDGKP